MNNFDFSNLLSKFEERVIVSGASNGTLKHLVKTADVPVSGCKLYKSGFGVYMGHIVDTDLILTIDYYGYLKRSRGFISFAEGKNSKTLKSKIIYFASIKIEDVVKATEDAEVIVAFPKLKDKILIKRGFRKERVELL